MRKFLIFVFLIFFAPFGKAEIVKDINIQGTSRVEDLTILNYLQVKKGQDVSHEQLNNATETLFETGLFSDVEINLRKGTLNIRVEEVPIIHSVYFSGNNAVNDDELAYETTLKMRSVYSKKKLKSDTERLLKLYKTKGYFSASINPVVRNFAQNKVDIIFDINEGEKAFVKEINFIGNEVFPSSTLKDVMLTKEKLEEKITSGDTTDNQIPKYKIDDNLYVFDSERFKDDQELIREFYFENGYLDFEILDSTAELMLDRKGFSLTIQLREGKKYRVSDTEIKVNLPVEVELDLKNENLLKPGEIAKIDLINESVDRMTDKLINLDYAFIEVKPDIIRDSIKQEVKVVFNISEGNKLFIRRINIIGNSKTADHIIRGVLLIKEGDAFNESKLKRSKKAVLDLNRFQKVDVNIKTDFSNPLIIDINLSVVEKENQEEEKSDNS